MTQVIVNPVLSIWFHLGGTFRAAAPSVFECAGNSLAVPGVEVGGEEVGGGGGVLDPP